VDGRRAGEWHDEDVAVVAASGAAEVRVREAVDAVVGVVVSGASVPSVEAGVGTGLHGAEGDDGAREGVSVAIGAHQRVHILRLRPRVRGGEGEYQEQELFHCLG